MNMVTTSYTPDEAPYGAWAWLILIVGVNVYWISFDLWARRNNHEYLTTEFREAMNNQLWGPLLGGLVAFTIAAFIVHMFSIGAKP